MNECRHIYMDMERVHDESSMKTHETSDTFSSWWPSSHHLGAKTCQGLIIKLILANDKLVEGHSYSLVNEKIQQNKCLGYFWWKMVCWWWCCCCDKKKTKGNGMHSKLSREEMESEAE